jgi:hypothetical protein
LGQISFILLDAILCIPVPGASFIPSHRLVYYLRILYNAICDVPYCLAFRRRRLATETQA